MSEIIYKSYTASQKNAIYKYRSQSKDKCNELAKKYNQQKKDDPEYIQKKKDSCKKYYDKKKLLQLNIIKNT